MLDGPVVSVAILQLQTPQDHYGFIAKHKKYQKNTKHKNTIRNHETKSQVEQTKMTLNITKKRINRRLWNWRMRQR